MLSFIVPAYNEEFELGHTLDGIKAAAGDREYEIVVVDDASTDRTPQIAQEAGARLVSINRRQIAAARNAGARAARGDILFFVDADTRINASHVSGALAALAAGCSGGGARLQTHGPIPLWARIFMASACVLYFGLRFGAGAFLFTTRANFEKSGRFDETLFIGEEVFFSQALKKLGRFEILPQPIVTSGRKLRMYSAGQIFLRLLVLMVGGMRIVRSRKYLGFWYDGKRETASTT